MITKVNLLKDSEAELFVELNKEELQEYLKKTGEKISGLVRVDGFRPGKTPLDVVRKEIGDKKILEEALELAVTASLSKALKKENLEIVSSSDLAVNENTAESLKYSIKLLLFPEIKLGNYKNLNVAKKDVQVEDREVDNAIASLLKLHTEYKDFNGLAEKGHHLEIDFTVTENGRLIEGGESKNHPLILGNGGFVPGFEEELVGLKKGETKTFSLQVPKDYYQKSVTGKKLNFKVAIKSIKIGAVPELTDEFIKNLSSFNSVENFKAVVTENLRSEKQQKETDRLRLEILEKVNKNSEIKVPAKMLREQLEAMVVNFDKSLHEKGMELGLYLAHLKKTQEDLKKEWHAEAENQIRRGLIMREVAKRENIKVDEDEVQKATNSLLARNMLAGGGLSTSSEIDAEKVKQKAGDLLLHEKIFEFLEKQNVEKTN